MVNVNAQTRTNSSAFRSMLEKHTLTGPNFNEWFCALKLVVRTEKIQDVFETAFPPRPVGGNGTLVSDHFLLMKSYLDQLASLNYTFDDKIAIGFILESLTSIKKNKKQTVGTSSITPQVMAIQGVQKKPHGKAKGKRKAKGGQYSYHSKTKKPQPQKKERPTKEGQCHHCKEVGH
nr:hypothetical protein [Tanacetum cinerariifolium]